MKSVHRKGELPFNNMSLAEKTLEYWQISSCRNNRPSKEYIISNAVKDVNNLLSVIGEHRKVFKHLVVLQDDIIKNGVKNGRKKRLEKSAKIFSLKQS